jgi:hypothetical protein
MRVADERCWKTANGNGESPPRVILRRERAEGPAVILRKRQRPKDPLVAEDRGVGFIAQRARIWAYGRPRKHPQDASLVRPGEGILKLKSAELIFTADDAEDAEETSKPFMMSWFPLRPLRPLR